MAWFLNHYECEECNQTREDEWSSCCDDECGECGADNMSPLESDDITIQIAEIDGDSGPCTIVVSPATAEDEPDYEDLRGDDGEPIVFADRAAAEAYLTANAEAIAAAREAEEDALWG